MLTPLTCHLKFTVSTSPGWSTVAADRDDETGLAPVAGRSGYWPWRFAHPTGSDVIVPDVATAARVAGSLERPRPVPTAMLAELDIGSWMGPASLPLWMDDPDWRGFATMSTARARALGQPPGFAVVDGSVQPKVSRCIE
jgi:hypothetical protein